MAEVPLSFPFGRDDFWHVLVRREGDVCLVERTNLRVDPPSVHWEVIVVQHSRAWRDRKTGRDYPPSETYPPSSMWGEAGWTFTERAMADAKMADLCLMVGRTASRRPSPRVGHVGGSGA